jgi:hypothetical protein
MEPKELLTTYSKNYEPKATGAYYHAHQVFNPYLWVPQMVQDPRISIALNYVKGAILSLAKFYVDEGDKPDDTSEGSPVKQFIVKQITRWWQTTAVKMLTAIEWGYAGLEPLYCQCNGQIHYAGANLFSQHDVKAVTKDGELRGLQLDQRDREPLYLGFPKSIWHVHRREHNPIYGESKLKAAFRPWGDLYHHNGLLAIKRLYFFKYGFQGETIYYPDGVHIAPSGQEIPYVDIARNILEQVRSGGIIALPSDVDTATGQRKWFLEPRPALSGAADLLEEVERLRVEMAEAIGVPPELIEASETGSGYSGRRVPQQAFRGMLQDIVYWLVGDFDKQVCRKLVSLNFGIDEPQYEIVPFGLIRDESENSAEAVSMQGTQIPISAVKSTAHSNKIAA